MANLLDAVAVIPLKDPNLTPGISREATITPAGAWSWTPPPSVVRARLHLQRTGGGDSIQ